MVLKKSYPTQVIQAAKNRATKLSQATCLLPNPTSKNQSANNDTDYKFNFITTYNQFYSVITKILKNIGHY